MKVFEEFKRFCGIIFISACRGKKFLTAGIADFRFLREVMADFSFSEQKYGIPILTKISK